jgi:DNA polymerase-3 subunit chi
MTKVDFYTGADDKLRTACQLAHKAMQHGLRIMLHTPEAGVADALDKLLWHYPAIAFLPHCRSHDAAAAEMPIVIDSAGNEFPHSELLVNLHIECLPFFSRFERVIEIVGVDADDAGRGRERYRFYKDRGYQLRHFKLGQAV